MAERVQFPECEVALIVASQGSVCWISRCLSGAHVLYLFRYLSLFNTLVMLRI